MTSPLRSPEISELRAFCLVADLGSLSRAARVLRISQPAMSKKIRTLESLAGSRLFERSVRGVELTTAGSQLYPEAHKVLAQSEIIARLMLGLSSHVSPVRLAASHTIAEFVLPELLARFEAQDPHRLSIELLISNSHNAGELVRVGRADIGVVASRPELDDRRDNLMVEIPYINDEIVVAVPTGHEWAKHDEIPLSWFAKTPLIMRDPGASSRGVVDHFIGLKGLKLAQAATEVGSTGAIIDTAISKCMPALISRIAAARYAGQVSIRLVKGIRFPRQFVIMHCGSEETLSPATHSFLKYLMSEQPRLCAPDTDVA